MKSIYKAFFVTLILSGALFALLKVMDLNNGETAKLALTPFGAIPFVYSKLEEIAKQRNEPGKLQTFSDYSLPHWKTFILASLSALALVEVLGGLLGVMFAVLSSITPGLPERNLLTMIFLISGLFGVYVIFCIGQWIGIRGKDTPFVGAVFVSAVFVGIFCKLADTAFAIFLFSRAKSDPDAPYFRAMLTSGLAPGCILFALVCVLG